MIVIQVVVTSVSDKGTDIAVKELDSLHGALRFVRSFKAKRGYVPVKWVIQEVEKML